MREQGGGKTVGIFTSGGTLATLVAQVLGLAGEQTYPVVRADFQLFSHPAVLQRRQSLSLVFQ